MFAGDLREPAAVKAAVDAAVAAFGKLDILVNNAGATKRADFFTLTEEDWQDGFALKFHGYVRATRAAWPHLRETRGCIINIVGIGSRAGSAEFTIGGSVNVALLNFTKAMADIGIKDGVRVNAINPGLIETERFSRNIERVSRDRGLDREQAMALPAVLARHHARWTARGDRLAHRLSRVGEVGLHPGLRDRHRWRRDALALTEAVPWPMHSSTRRARSLRS